MLVVPLQLTAILNPIQVMSQQRMQLKSKSSVDGHHPAEAPPAKLKSSSASSQTPFNDQSIARRRSSATKHIQWQSTTNVTSATLCSGEYEKDNNDTSFRRSSIELTVDWDLFPERPGLTSDSKSTRHFIEGLLEFAPNHRESSIRNLFSSTSVALDE